MVPRASIGHFGAPENVIEPGTCATVDDVHKFWCGDTLKLSGELPVVDVIYTDLPWNPAINKSFWRWAGVDDPRGFDSFIEGFVELVKAKCSGVLIVEMGVSKYAQLRDLLEAAGGVGREVNATYGAKNTPHKLWVGSFTGADLPDVPDGLHGKQTVQAVVSSAVRPGMTFMDPCAGKLDFCRAAMHAGATVYGVELIPKKLSKGLNAMRRKHTVKWVM